MKPVYITLKLKGDQNRIGNAYICQLPQNFDTTSEIKVGLQSVDIHFKANISENFRLKIEILEASNQEVVKSDKHVIWSDHISRGISRNFTEIENSPLLSLDNRSLSYFTICLRNSNNEEVDISENQFSFLRIKLMKMSQPSSIHIYHDAKMDKEGTFRVNLSNYISVPQKCSWDLAVSQIGFHNPNNKIRKELKIAVVYKNRMKTASFRYPAPDVEFIIEKIKETIKLLIPTLHNLISISVKNEKLEIKSELDSYFYIQFNSDLGLLMGCDKNFDMSRKIIYIPGKSSVTLSEKIDLSREIVYSVLIKSSIIQPSLYNDGYQPILRVFPMDGGLQPYVYKTFKNLEHIEITPSSLSTIDFTIHDENNYPFPDSNVDRSVFIHIVIRYNEQ